jgi:Resolvase, N terminal domain
VEQPSSVLPWNVSEMWLLLLVLISCMCLPCPDRLARNYAHQVLLLEEFLRAGIEVIFLNREVGQTPEDQLLLQVQGMIAEYERAKILERSRRGKRHGAQVGKVSVLGGAPYGYRYVTKQEGAGEASLEIVWEEARVVRQAVSVGRTRSVLYWRGSTSSASSEGADSNWQNGLGPCHDWRHAPPACVQRRGSMRAKQ